MEWIATDLNPKLQAPEEPPKLQYHFQMSLFGVVVRNFFRGLEFGFRFSCFSSGESCEDAQETVAIEPPSPLTFLDYITAFDFEKPNPRELQRRLKDLKNHSRDEHALDFDSKSRRWKRRSAIRARKFPTTSPRGSACRSPRYARPLALGLFVPLFHRIGRAAWRSAFLGDDKAMPSGFAAKRRSALV